MKKKHPTIKNLDPSNEGIGIWRAIRLGIQNFWRNKLLSFATILVMAVIIFIFNVIMGIQAVTHQALQALSERVDVVIYLHDDITYDTVSTIMKDLEKIPGVTKVKYTSKEEALEIVTKTHPKTAELLKKFNLNNPLPPSLSIVTKNPEDQTVVQNFLEQSPYQNVIQSYRTDSTDRQGAVLSNVTKNLQSLSQFVHQIVFWMIFVFVLGGTLIMVNAIQLTIYMRRHEISIMKLVGATPEFLRIPFLFEACLYGFFAVSLSFLLILLLGSQLSTDTVAWNLGAILPLPTIFLGETVITLILAIMSSSIAIQRYMHGKI